MLSPDALAIGEQILIDLFVPPVATWLAWVIFRRWVLKVQGVDVSEVMSKRQKRRWWIILAGKYLFVFPGTIYGLLTG